MLNQNLDTESQIQTLLRDAHLCSRYTVLRPDFVTVNTQTMNTRLDRDFWLLTNRVSPRE